MDKMKNNLVFASLFITLVMMISSVSAFGASTPYWDKNPLKLTPGEYTVVELTLQNMVGNEDISLIAEITSDGDGIATLVNQDNVYFVPLGIEDVKVPIRVEINKIIKQGDTREIIISFTQVSSNQEEGMVSLSNGFTTKMTVEIVAEEESVLFNPSQSVDKGVPMWIWLLIVAIIILAVVAFLVYKKK